MTEMSPSSTDPHVELAGSTGAVTLVHTDEVAVLAVSGALDLALAPKLQHLVDRAMRQAPSLLIIDLTEVSFLASVGMAVLVKVHRGSPVGMAVRIVAEGRLVLRPLQLTRLTDELAIYPTLAGAREAQ